jgi:hypothetical protein
MLRAAKFVVPRVGVNDENVIETGFVVVAIVCRKASLRLPIVRCNAPALTWRLVVDASPAMTAFSQVPKRAMALAISSAVSVAVPPIGEHAIRFRLLLKRACKPWRFVLEGATAVKFVPPAVTAGSAGSFE